MVLTSKGSSTKYLGGSGDALTIWISIAASTVLVFYGYDQVSPGLSPYMTPPLTTCVGSVRKCPSHARFPRHHGQPLSTRPRDHDIRIQPWLFCWRIVHLVFWRQARQTEDSYTRQPHCCHWCRHPSCILGCSPDVCWPCRGWLGYWHEHCHCWRVAVRDVKNAKPWKTSHYPNGKLHRRLLLVKLADLGLLVRSGQRIMAISTGLPSLQVVRSLLLFGKDILTSKIVFSGLIMLICPFLPDSPRLLIRKGKYDEAHAVLAALQGDDATADSPSVRTQFSIIKGILDTEYAVTYTWWQLFTGKGPAGVVRRMILGAWMQAMNQISGINVTSYYMTVS